MEPHFSFLFWLHFRYLPKHGRSAPIFTARGYPGPSLTSRSNVWGEPTPLPAGYVSPDADLKLMAAWALRHLIRNPRPALNYEPVFFIRPLHFPPAPEGHDPIVPGDTDCRLDWEFIFMREISGSREGLDVEKGLRRRILGYVGKEGLAWVTPGARMEGQVYTGKEVPQEKEAWPWTTSKIIRSLSETYVRTGDVSSKELARKMFVALRKLASWDSGRAYFGGGGWRGGRWVTEAQWPPPFTALEPIVRYWEASGDREALDFAASLTEGMIASPELLARQNADILPSGEFHGHMHGTLNAVWGVAHLAARGRSGHFQQAWPTLGKKDFGFASKNIEPRAWRQRCQVRRAARRRSQRSFSSRWRAGFFVRRPRGVPAPSC